MSDPYDAYRLPPGRHGLGPETVRESQRWRLIGASADVFADAGYLRATTRAIARRAHVSSHTFYIHFADLDEALRVSGEVACAALREALRVDCAASREGLGEAIGAGLELARSEPSLVEMIGQQAAAAIPPLAAEREALFAELGERLGAGGFGRHAVAGDVPLVLTRLGQADQDLAGLGAELGGLLGRLADDGQPA